MRKKLRYNAEANILNVINVEGGVMKDHAINEYLAEKLKNSYFKELYEFEEQKFSVVKKIVAFRIQHKLSQNQLAERIGVTQQHISKIENGDFSSFATLAKILFNIGYAVRLQTIPIRHNKYSRVKRALAAKRK